VNERGIALEATTIVIRGAFNPAIFSPSWFRDQNLVGASELEAQRIQIITRDVAIFSLDWLDCHITADSLQFATGQPEEFERLRDVALGTLRILSYTPISALGINRDFHTTLKTAAQWHAIGDALVPKNIWEDDLILPGMKSVTLWGRRPDGLTGHIQIQVEPSARLPLSVYISTNDHFSLTADTSAVTSRDDAAWDLVEDEGETTPSKVATAISILLERWDDVLVRAEKARARVIRLAGSEQ
jgi:hypothetical protein